MPNRMNTQGYTSLIDHPNGVAHFGAWCALVEICSTREPRELRGTLPESDGTVVGISRALGRISRFPPDVFEELLPRLLDDPEISWIEDYAAISGKSPGTSGKSPDASGENPGTSGGNPETPAANRRELNRIGGEGTGGEASVARLPRWKSDEHFARFATDYLSTGGAFIDSDFHDAFENCWRKLSIEQRLQRVAGLNRHMEEYCADPRFAPKPRKFLETEWERPPRPAPAIPIRRQDSLAERAGALIQQRLLKGERPI